MAECCETGRHFAFKLIDAFCNAKKNYYFCA